MRTEHRTKQQAEVRGTQKSSRTHQRNRTEENQRADQKMRTDKQEQGENGGEHSKKIEQHPSQKPSRT